MATTLTINGKPHQVDLPDDVPLLWVLRDEVGLTGFREWVDEAVLAFCEKQACHISIEDHDDADGNLQELFGGSPVVGTLCCYLVFLVAS